jgi:hypothetical protein
MPDAFKAGTTVRKATQALGGSLRLVPRALLQQMAHRRRRVRQPPSTAPTPTAIGSTTLLFRVVRYSYRATTTSPASV